MKYFSKTALAAFATICFALPPIAARAGDDQVVLTIDGAIAGGTSPDFTIEQLEALGTQVIETSTPWHEGVVKFEGVPLAKLMDYVGANGETVYVVALNNYSTEIPIADFAAHGVILASRKDGALMPVSDKGPLFVIYPFDAKPELNSELYYSRSAWQVRQITIE